MYMYLFAHIYIQLLTQSTVSMHISSVIYHGLLYPVHFIYIYILAVPFTIIYIYIYKYAYFNLAAHPKYCVNAYLLGGLSWSAVPFTLIYINVYILAVPFIII
jgi:hypothetical protein